MKHISLKFTHSQVNYQIGAQSYLGTDSNEFCWLKIEARILTAEMREFRWFKTQINEIASLDLVG